MARVPRVRPWRCSGLIARNCQDGIIIQSENDRSCCNWCPGPGPACCCIFSAAIDICRGPHSCHVPRPGPHRWWTSRHSAPHTADTAQPAAQSNTHRDVDDELVRGGVVAHDGALHLAAEVGEVHSLASHQLLQPAHAPEAGADQVCLEKFTQFSAVIEAHCVARGQPRALPVRGRPVRGGGAAVQVLDCLDDGGVEPAVLARGHDPRAQDGALGQPLAGGHGGV